MSMSLECMLRRLLLACAIVFAIDAAAADRYPGIGRTATAAEIAAWDIDVRPDFKGLPPGAGTVARGMAVWEARCASCHGTFGESNEFFTPMIGGTTPADIKSGRVATLANDMQPQRTTLMKLSTLSTLWDYINRAMPWTAPKSLTVEEVYAVTAYILHMGDIVPADFTLSDKNIGEVQQRLPNRDGMTTAHGLATVRGKPDVRNTACMANCGGPVTIASSLPAYARNAHGNNAEQNRLVGPVRGADTLAPAPAAIPAAPLAGKRMVAATDAAKPADDVANGVLLVKKHGCVACHNANAALLGPSWIAVHKKYSANGAGDVATISALENKIRLGGAGVWGAIPMPAQAQLAQPELQVIVRWLLTDPK